MTVGELFEYLVANATTDMHVKLHNGWLHDPFGVSVEFDDRTGESVVVIR